MTNKDGYMWYCPLLRTIQHRAVLKNSSGRRKVWCYRRLFSKRFYIWIKNIHSIPNLSWRILRIKWRILRSPMPKEQSVYIGCHYTCHFPLGWKALGLAQGRQLFVCECSSHCEIASRKFPRRCQKDQKNFFMTVPEVSSTHVWVNKNPKRLNHQPIMRKWNVPNSRNHMLLTYKVHFGKILHVKPDFKFNNKTQLQALQ